MCIPSTSASVAITTLFVPEVLDPVLHVQGSLKEIELFILVYYLLCQSNEFSGLPLRLKTAWVSTSLDFVMEPLAESPSVMKIVDSSFLGSFVLYVYPAISQLLVM
jgi:hypothetical protein